MDVSFCSVMNLLAEIYSQEEMIPKIFEALTLKENIEFDLNELGSIDDTGEGISLQDNPFMLSTLAPRLWPFMRHSITSVRYSAILTLVSYSWLCLSCLYNFLPFVSLKGILMTLKYAFCGYNDFCFLYKSKNKG